MLHWINNVRPAACPFSLYYPYLYCDGMSDPGSFREERLFWLHSWAGTVHYGGKYVEMGAILAAVVAGG